MVAKPMYPITEVKRMLDLRVDQGKAMREQAVLREEMQYHYRLGNTEVSDFVLASVQLGGYLESKMFLNIANKMCFIKLQVPIFGSFHI